MYTGIDKFIYDSDMEELERLAKDKEMFRTLLLNRLEAKTVIEYSQKENEVLNKLEEWVGL